MSDEAEVLEAARARAAALVAGDAPRLLTLLHPDFRWTSHTGESFDRARYVEANSTGWQTWRRQDLGEPEVVVAGRAAVLRTVVTDTVETPGGAETNRMPMTQVWVRGEQGWQCLAGHAGPRMPPGLDPPATDEGRRRAAPR